VTAGTLAGRLYLVTGASRGLGRATALALAGAGAKLVLVARTVGALEELDDAQKALSGEAAVLVPLDLNDLEAIDRLGGSLYQRFGRLDGLFAAAAQLGQLSPMGHLPPAVWEAVLRLNATVNYRLIRSLDPLLRAAPAARALFVTDRNNRNRAYWNAYDASKAALETAVISYAGELNKTAVRVNLAAPAPFASRLRTTGFPGENPASLRRPEAVAAALLPLLLPDCQRQGDIVDV
jgi:NAD(P)-dependent dehydrogenase (short-subunit alcohol dehydrogenase family)